MRNRRYITQYRPVIDLAAIHKASAIGLGGAGTASGGNWSYSWEKDATAITVKYMVGNENISNTIRLVSQPLHFGGLRYFMVCPRCSSQRKKLYIENRIAACSKCHRLHYQSQSMGTLDRELNRLDRLLVKTNNLGYRFDGYTRPKHQHHKTHQAISNKIESTEQRIFRQIDKRFLGKR